VLGSGTGLAQSPRATPEQRSEPESEEEAEGAPKFEAEFVASAIFQGGTVAGRLRSPLTLEGHYFGVEDNEIGIVGLAWTFSKGALRVVPGIGWSFASASRPAAVITARWSYEHPRWITQGLWVQSLRAHVPAHEDEEHHAGEGEADDVRYASILDGVHASAVVGHLEVGPLAEHIQYREEREWKGGARVAWRIGRGVKIVGQVLGPGAEVRGGLVWER
jgi:hypothetical protein